MIRRATFRNFKALRDLSIDLERFTVLVGPNASGKSSVLQGLDLLLGLRQEGAPHFHPPAFSGHFYSHRGQGPLEIEAATEVRGFVFRALRPNGTQAGGGGGTGGNGAWQFHLLTYEAADPEKRLELHKAPRARDEIPGAIYLRLDAKKLAAPSMPTERRPAVKADGEGLASALAYLALNQPGAFSDLKASLRRLFPYVADVRFDRVQLGQWAEALLFDFDGAKSVPAPQVSDGTLLVLGLLAAVYQQGDQPHVILLDDLDHALHPTAQRELVKLLRALLDSRPELQVIATTHSPYLLDELSPCEVRLMNRLPDGSAACATLADHPDFERWKDEMGPGEFWSTVGEQWVGQARSEVPVP